MLISFRNGIVVILRSCNFLLPCFPHPNELHRLTKQYGDNKHWYKKHLHIFKTHTFSIQGTVSKFNHEHTTSNLQYSKCTRKHQNGLPLFNLPRRLNNSYIKRIHCTTVALCIWSFTSVQTHAAPTQRSPPRSTPSTPHLSYS